MGYNILNDIALDSVLEPAEQFMSDWMHCGFVGGVWIIGMQMVLDALWADGIRDAYDSLFEYVQRWRFPKRLGNSKLHELFAKSIRKRVTKQCASNVRQARAYRCTASSPCS